MKGLREGVDYIRYLALLIFFGVSPGHAAIADTLPATAPVTSEETQIIDTVIASAKNARQPTDLETIRWTLINSFPLHESYITDSFTVLLKEVSHLPHKTSEPQPQTPEKASIAKANEDRWNVGATAALGSTRGNSDTSSAGLTLRLNKKTEKLEHKLAGFFDFANANGRKSRDIWGANYQVDLNLKGENYSYGRIEYDDNGLSGFDYRIFAGLGFGREVVRNANLSWRVEGGPGFRYSPRSGSDEADETIAVYGATEAKWKISGQFFFQQKSSLTYTNPTTTFLSDSSLKAALTNSIQVGVGYQFRYETNPPDGRVNKDTTFKTEISLEL